MTTHKSAAAVADYRLLVAAEEALTAIVLLGPVNIAGAMIEPRNALRTAIAKLEQAYADLAEIPHWDTVRKAARSA